MSISWILKHCYLFCQLQFHTTYNIVIYIDKLKNIFKKFDFFILLTNLTDFIFDFDNITLRRAASIACLRETPIAPLVTTNKNAFGLPLCVPAGVS